MGGLWPKRYTNVGGKGWRGLRAPFLGLAPACHVACLRERLPLGHRDCPAPPVVCPGIMVLKDVHIALHYSCVVYLDCR